MQLQEIKSFKLNKRAARVERVARRTPENTGTGRDGTFGAGQSDKVCQVILTSEAQEIIKHMLQDKLWLHYHQTINRLKLENLQGSSI